MFTRDASGLWSQQAYSKANNTGVDDRFGTSIALDGDTLAVGAGRDAGIAIGSGAVYVFTRDASDVWSQQAYIKASNPDTRDFFSGNWMGGSRNGVALDGDTLAVGAIEEGSSATGIDGDQAPP